MAQPKFLISFPNEHIPYASLALSGLLSCCADYQWNPDESSYACLKTSSGEELCRGSAAIATFVSKNSTFGSYPPEKLAEWVEFCGFIRAEDKETNQVVQSVLRLNDFLMMRCFLVGPEPTVIDFIVWEALKQASSFHKTIQPLFFHGRATYITAWYHTLQRLTSEPVKIFTKYQVWDMWTLNVDESRLQKHLSDPQLPEVEMEKVMVCFSLTSSECLHLGHAGILLMSSYFAEKYHGNLLFIINDTDPSPENKKTKKTIVQDLSTLVGTRYYIIHTSHYFPELERFCADMINKGCFYADHIIENKPSGDILDKKESIAAWQKMVQGKIEGQSYCIRARFKDDPIMYRCEWTPHDCTANHVYPSSDLCTSFLSILIGVTHIVWPSHISNDFFLWIADKIATKAPVFWECNCFPQDHHDYQAQLPTIRELLHQGLALQALKHFVWLLQSQNGEYCKSWDYLWEINRKCIDLFAPKVIAISANNLIQLHLTNGPSEMERRPVQRHPNNPLLGSNQMLFSNSLLVEKADFAVGEQIHLIHWENCVIENVIFDTEGKLVEIVGHLSSNGDSGKSNREITWLANYEPEFQKLTLRSCKNFFGEHSEEDLSEKIEVLCGMDDFGSKDYFFFEQRGYYFVNRSLEGCGIFEEIPTKSQ